MKRSLPLFAVVPLLLTACAVTPAATPAPPGAPAGAGASAAGAPGTVSCDYRTTNQPAKPVDPPSGAAVPATGTATVLLHFAAGAVSVTLDRAAAPCTVHSFESLAQQGFFTDTKCHRLTTQGIFVLQCGDPSGTGRGGPGYWFDDELAKTRTYPKGTVAMANAGPNTNGSQFFLVYADTTLPPNYTVFGHLDDAGLKIVADIAAKGADDRNGPGDGAPKGDASIKNVSVG